MPTFGMALTDLAAFLGVWAFWRRGERAVASIIALSLALPAGLFITMFVVGEAIGSWLGLTP